MNCRRVAWSLFLGVCVRGGEGVGGWEVGGAGLLVLIVPFHLLHRPGPSLQSVFLFNS